MNLLKINRIARAGSNALVVSLCGVSICAAGTDLGYVSASLASSSIRTGDFASEAKPLNNDYIPYDPGPIQERPVTLLIATQKTAAPRHDDSVANARKHKRRSVAALVRLRRAEDENFLHKVERLRQRLQALNGNMLIQTAAVSTGAQLMYVLVSASRKGPIANLVIYGHAAPRALYMAEDSGFYVSVTEVAKRTRLVSGIDAEKVSSLSKLGARDLDDLQTFLRKGEIRFAQHATILFAGCAVAGKRRLEAEGMAVRLAEMTAATTIGSVGMTDQSMARGKNVQHKEYSRGSWVRLTPGRPPQTLKSRVMDVIEHVSVALREQGPTTAARHSPGRSPDAGYREKLKCAYAPTRAALDLCGRKQGGRDATAGKYPNEIRRPRA